MRRISDGPLTSVAADAKELKYAFPPEARIPLQGWLSAHCVRDRTHPFNIVSSIYYDTPDLQQLSEKRNSEYLKTKFRVRWYDDNGENRAPQAYVEIKRRTGSTREKTRFPIAWTFDAKNGLNEIDPALSSIPELLRKNGFNVSNHLIPTMLIRYRRHRYSHAPSGTRINLDSDIAATAVNVQAIRSSVPLPITTTICEVKGRLSKLPPELYALTMFGGRRHAFSKYHICYQSLTRQFVL